MAAAWGASGTAAGSDFPRRRFTWSCPKTTPAEAPAAGAEHPDHLEQGRIVQSDLRAVKAGRKVRLVYELRRDGTGVAERIDIMSKVTGEEPPDTDT